jgi:hypothetical protein
MFAFWRCRSTKPPSGWFGAVYGSWMGKDSGGCGTEVLG